MEKESTMKNYIALLLISAMLTACSSSQNTSQTNNIIKTKVNSAVVYTTAPNSDLRLTKTDNLIFKPYPQPLEIEVSVFVNPQKQYQNFLGIGGAITDASAEVFAKLSKEKQQEFLNAYYSVDKGIGYSLARTNIHSCDFSSGSYTYVDEGDKDLKSFSIQHDKHFRIPLIKKAIETA